MSRELLSYPYVRTIIALLFIHSLSTNHVAGFTVGPPPLPTVCKTMNPQHHDYKAQSTDSPFMITADRTEVAAGSSVFVNLFTIDPETKFIGFYVQARDENDNPIGTFNPNANTKVHNCFGRRANAAHHASGLVKKDNVTIVWTAPDNFHGEVVFTATAMRDFVTYWVFLQTDPVQVVNDRADNVPTTPPPRRTTRRPRPNLNNTFVQLLSDIGSIFTAITLPTRRPRPRVPNSTPLLPLALPLSSVTEEPEIRIQSAGSSTTNVMASSSCSENRVFQQWFCNLFRNSNHI